MGKSKTLYHPVTTIPCNTTGIITCFDNQIEVQMKKILSNLDLCFHRLNSSVLKLTL